MMFGYMYETKFLDFPRSMKFYKKAHLLRNQNNIRHCCLFTDDEMKEIDNDSIHSLGRLKQIIKENKRVWSKEYKPSDLCEKCIHAQAKIDDDFERSIYFPKGYKYSFYKTKHIV
ncbi:hypothetical protein RF11_14217 [Thelohanellus kitauei]|uniref:Uncharacterized protein n=1 Tax=Thelohanellus kitauei TaxID=669202 RepID=A0A0C2MGL6_THEKT|nr:hypothetical protein RF11_14217 [Thelohanellus kitauei]